MKFNATFQFGKSKIGSKVTTQNKIKSEKFHQTTAFWKSGHSDLIFRNPVA